MCLFLNKTYNTGIIGKNIIQIDLYGNYTGRLIILSKNKGKAREENNSFS